VVWSGGESNVMGSVYIAERQPQPLAGYGKVLFSYEEFSKFWTQSDRRLLVFLHDRDIRHLNERAAVAPKKVLSVGDVTLISNW
jgi:hypothetical protein